MNTETRNWSVRFVATVAQVTTATRTIIPGKVLQTRLAPVTMLAATVVVTDSSPNPAVNRYARRRGFARAAVAGYLTR